MCVALPGQIVKVHGEDAVIDVAGVPRRVSLSLLVVEGTRVDPGDWVLAGAGLAVRRLAEEEALELLDTWEADR